MWQVGAQGETHEIVQNMLDCCKAINPEKWEVLTAAITEPMKHHRVMRASKSETQKCTSGWFQNITPSKKPCGVHDKK